MSSTSAKTYLHRLKKEVALLERDPVPYILARPNPVNILEWHYVIWHLPDGPYEGGVYHGKLKFPVEFPYRPPSIMMLTPSGRFETNSRLCLSISDFHPETWNPLWTVGSILQGLLSFMQDTVRTTGSVESSLSEKRRLARSSMAFNMKDALFVSLFPEVVEEYQQQLSSRGEAPVDKALTSQHSLTPLLLVLSSVVVVVVGVIAAYHFSSRENNTN
eukprot:GILI01007813.1.p1 GENE.GILI01007813.1~~GILI01007813.1.p1  ORF type:complete len:217 (+),score=47.37 GILI01007813.1:268-918(+)